MSARTSAACACAARQRSKGAGRTPAARAASRNPSRVRFREFSKSASLIGQKRPCSAAQAAAFSLSQTLRAEMRSAGIRVVNVFPGPIDDEWTQLVPPPKLAPAALAKAVVKALKDGVEDIYPGDVAQDLFAKWQDSAKVLEREMWDQ